MKRISALLLAAVLMVSCLVPAVSAASESVHIVVNGSPVKWTDARPYVNAANRTMVPLRAVAEVMGLDMTWTSNTATFSVSGSSRDCPWTTSMTFTIGQKTAKVSSTAYWPNSEPDTATWTVSMDAALTVINNRTYAPIRYLAETFGCVVNWIPSTNIVEIFGIPSQMERPLLENPASYPYQNFVMGVWELDNSNWTSASISKYGKYTTLILYKDGTAEFNGYVHTQGRYQINVADGWVTAAVTLDNGWKLTLHQLQYALDVIGMPPTTIRYANGSLETTSIWGFVGRYLGDPLDVIA